MTNFDDLSENILLEILNLLILYDIETYHSLRSICRKLYEISIYLEERDIFWKHKIYQLHLYKYDYLPYRQILDTLIENRNTLSEDVLSMIRKRDPNSIFTKTYYDLFYHFGGYDPNDNLLSAIENNSSTTVSDTVTNMGSCKGLSRPVRCAYWHRYNKSGNVYSTETYTFVNSGLLSFNLIKPYIRVETVKILNLMKNNLIEFPKTLFICNNLVELDLSDNYIHKLPTKGEEMINLKKLNISYNYIETLPSWIIAQKDKEFNINISGNPFIDPFSTVRECLLIPDIYCVEASGIYLKSIPVCKSTVRNLILCKNMIDIIPENIKYFEHLTTLDLSCNKLIMITPELFTMPLTMLNLSGNNISTLPAINVAHKINELYLGWNRFIEIPLKALYHKRMLLLDLRGNSFMSISKVSIYAQQPKHIVIDEIYKNEFHEMIKFV